MSFTDSSPTIYLKIEMDAQLKEGDGAFWITFEDFTDFFTTVNVCMVRQPETEPHGKARKPWEESRKRFTFKMEDGEDGKEVTAPAFLLTLSARSEHVYVGVHQKDERCVGASKYIDVGITILKVISHTYCTVMWTSYSPIIVYLVAIYETAPYLDLISINFFYYHSQTHQVDPSSPTGYVLLESTVNLASRQNQTDVMSLDAGQYYIVPTTSGAMLRQVCTPSTLTTS